MIKKLSDIFSSTGFAIVNIFIRAFVLWMIVTHYGLLDKIMSGVFPLKADVVDWFGFCISLVVILSFFRPPPKVVRPELVQKEQPPVLLLQLANAGDFFSATSIPEKDIQYGLTRLGNGWLFKVGTKVWEESGHPVEFTAGTPEGCLSEFFDYVNNSNIDLKTLNKRS